MSSMGRANAVACWGFAWFLHGTAIAQSSVELGCGLEPGPTRAVVRVIDGMTAELDDRTTIRLAGVLAPRAEDVGAARSVWEPETASHRGLAALIEGKSVTLAFAGPRADRYGRTLAHLFVGEADRRIWVQGRLAETGHARIVATPQSDACMAQLLAREAIARNERLGLWSHAAYQVLPADRPSELARFNGTLALVRGRVARVQTGRQATLIDMQSDERDGRTLRLVVPRPSRALAEFGKPALTAGTAVLVRGWIELGSRGLPEIVLLARGQIVADP
jgi:endonuclease YncB( thermonuclease family)